MPGDDVDCDHVSLYVLFQGDIYTTNVGLELREVHTVLGGGEQVVEGLKCVAVGGHAEKIVYMWIGPGAASRR